MKYILIALLFCICYVGEAQKIVDSGYLPTSGYDEILLCRNCKHFNFPIDTLPAKPLNIMDSAIKYGWQVRWGPPTLAYHVSEGEYRINQPDTTKPLNIKMKPRWRDSVEHDTIYLAPLHDPNTFNNSGWLSTGGYDTFLHKVDSIKSKWTDASKATRPTVFTITPIQDTIRCVLLVSDTSSHYFINDYRTQRYYWMYGWEISELWMIFNEGEPAYKPIGYLDDKKVPISNNLVVWLSKELK